MIVFVILILLILIFGIAYGVIFLRNDRKPDGEIMVSTNESGGKLYTLVLNDDPVDLDLKEYVIFKVTKNEG